MCSAARVGSKLSMPAWLIWLLATLVLLLGEIATPGLFFLGPLALAAGVSAVVAGAGAGAALQITAFIAGSVAAVAVLRPIARRHVRLPTPQRTGAQALVGQSAVVLRRVDATGGRVKIGGEEWSARAYLEDEVLEVGAPAAVIEIEGATALVS